MLTLHALLYHCAACCNLETNLNCTLLAAWLAPVSLIIFVYYLVTIAVNQQQGRRIGSITDYDPVNEGTGSVAQTYHRPPPPQQQAPPQQTQQQKLQQYYQQQQRQHALHVQQQQALQQQLAMQQQQQQQQLAMQQQAAAAQQQYYAAGVSSGYHQPAPQHQRANGVSRLYINIIEPSTRTLHSNLRFKLEIQAPDLN